MVRFVSFFTTLKTDWNTRSPFSKAAPALAVLAIYFAFSSLSAFTPDHRNLSLLILVLGYGGPTLRRVLHFLLPLVLTALVYDSQRWYSNIIRGRIRVEEPYWFDKTFFGINTPTGRLTPNEWFQLHTHPILDFVSGFYYLTFIAIFVLFAAYLHFYVAKKGTKKTSAHQMSQETKWVMWSFFIINVIGYTTYYWYPAAPPWYVALYGLGPANLSALPNPAGCLRFDALFGTHFFTGMYGRSADVFGAIPSLHIAYPLQAVFYAFRFGAGRIFALSFYLIMCFSAVYLNHHYVLDLIWGSAYAVLIHLILHRWILTNKTKVSMQR